uniref:Uncharacterized protein n=1 Tax=Anguilla anguilla TaxID=7936 RepID=A0A0E9QM55_ANGAN
MVGLTTVLTSAFYINTFFGFLSGHILPFSGPECNFRNVLDFVGDRDHF